MAQELCEQLGQGLHVGEQWTGEELDQEVAEGVRVQGLGREAGGDDGVGGELEQGGDGYAVALLEEVAVEA